VALVLLKGEPLEEVSRLTGQPAHVLKGWRETFLQGGQATFHVGEAAKEKALEEENTSLKAKGGGARHGQRPGAREDRAPGERSPFALEEIEALSKTCSIATKRRDGWSHVCRVWGIPRVTVYDWQRCRRATGQTVNRRGRHPLVSDEDLVAAMKPVLASSAQDRFHSDGDRKVLARLRHRGMRADKERVWRLMVTYDLLAPRRTGKSRGLNCMMERLSRSHRTWCGARMRQRHGR
jgi:hypothetical protein